MDVARSELTTMRISFTVTHNVKMGGGLYSSHSLFYKALVIKQTHMLVKMKCTNTVPIRKGCLERQFRDLTTQKKLSSNSKVKFCKSIIAC